MSNTVGYVLLVAALVPFIGGFVLSLIGLTQARRAATAVKGAADAATHHTRELLGAAAESDAHQKAALVAQSNAALGHLDAVNDGLSGLNQALGALKGPLAPARVCFALAALLVSGAFVSFGIVSVSAGSGDSPSTTQTVPTGTSTTVLTVETTTTVTTP